MPQGFRFGRIVRNQMNRDSIGWRLKGSSQTLSGQPSGDRAIGQRRGWVAACKSGGAGRGNQMTQALSITMINDLINEKMYFSWQVITSSLCVFFETMSQRGGSSCSFKWKLMIYVPTHGLASRDCVTASCSVKWPRRLSQHGVCLAPASPMCISAMVISVHFHYGKK